MDDILTEILGRAGEADYRGAFAKWDARASVRVKPRRRLGDTEDLDQIFFPPELLPVLSHPGVIARGPLTRYRLLVHALYQYLHFTTVLEQAVVLPVATQISAGLSGTTLPTAMRSDAFKIVTDEAWHAQFSYEFMHEIARVTGVQPSAIVKPGFVQELSRLREPFASSARPLTDLFFAVVSETLISGMLATIPNDKRLPLPVRALVGDHAEDEGRHNAYFRSFLRILWPALSREEQHLIGLRVPDLIRIFLQPDACSVQSILEASGFQSDLAAEITADSGANRVSAAELRHAARGTLSAFRDAGALDDPLLHEAFRAAGLTDDISRSASVIASSSPPNGSLQHADSS